MKYFGLVWRSLWRKRIRTSLTILSIAVAFLLFTLLSALTQAMSAGGAMTGVARLVVIDKVTLINPLPIAYLPKIESIPGVEDVTYQTWFGSYYQETRQQIPGFPVDPDRYVSVYPELIFPDGQFEAWKKNRTGIAIGKAVAERYGWKTGDRIPIQSEIYSQKDGNRTWEFDVEAVFDSSDKSGGTAFAMFHHEYFREANSFGSGFVGWYTVRLADGADGAAVADAIDTQFANSPNETETSTEEAFAASFANQFGNLVLIASLILGAVFFTLLLVAGNTMSQSVRERISELAVMKTLGFKDRSVLGIVLSEAVLTMLIGGIIGMLLGWAMAVAISDAMQGMIPGGIVISWKLVASGVGFMLGAGIVSGIFPALKAMRLSIVDALARG